ncbi:MAG: hypothetical protein AMJ43_07950 [Coxiella sp. DG_40]|nr:MAG: hypothetical protein AMJ43_07950 [Coxiella sp. DG_40]
MDNKKEELHIITKVSSCFLNPDSFVFINEDNLVDLISSTYTIDNMSENENIYLCDSGCRRGEKVNIRYLCKKKDFPNIAHNGIKTEVIVDGVKYPVPDHFDESLNVTIGDIRKFLERIPEYLDDIPVMINYSDSYQGIQEIEFIETSYCCKRSQNIDRRVACYTVPPGGCSRDICDCKSCEFFYNLKCKDFEIETALLIT